VNPAVDHEALVKELADTMRERLKSYGDPAVGFRVEMPSLSLALAQQFGVAEAKRLALEVGKLVFPPAPVRPNRAQRRRQKNRRVL